ADLFVETFITKFEMRHRESHRMLRCDQPVSCIDDLMKIRLDLKRRKTSVRGREEPRGNIHACAAVTLPAPDEIGEKKAIDKKLRMVLETDARARLQFENVEAVILPEQRIDAPW